MTPFVVLAVAYVLGAIPFGYLLVRWKTGRDVREHGSGNIGATNVMRTTGRAAGIATLVLDIAKGYLAVWIAGRLTSGDLTWMSVASVAVILGHAYPVFLRFKGGKAVASLVGAMLALAPAALGAVAVVFLGVAVWTRHISMASIVSAAVLPLAVWLLLLPPWPVLAATLFAGAFIIYRHRTNIQRLRAGTEHVFSLGVRRP
jgi:glycerol-3-phosphate acyltransferase PlsY